MQLKKTVLTSILLFLFLQMVEGQDQPYFVKKYPDSLSTKRLLYVVGGQSLVYATSLTVLYQAWYKDYPQSGFHWINDNGEWLQMDKIGHATTSAYFGKMGYEMYRWAGVNRKKAIWIGGSTGFIFLTVIEILDGFSEQWGASSGDLIANAAGTGLFISQQLLWNDQRFTLKWSYSPSEYAKYNPDQLGSTAMESMLKDYNGQTYWLSGNIKSFLPKTSKFPFWLNVSFGYGADGMLGANSNPSEIDGLAVPDFPRYRQYYLSLDVDMARIKTKSHFLRFLLNGFNFIKVPFPTVEFNKYDKVKFHWIYF
jgi:hypothetical protein